jgi:hypothetical protein
MRTRNRNVIVSVSLIVVAFAGCGGAEEPARTADEVGSAPARTDSSSRTLAIPGVDDAGDSSTPEHTAHVGLQWDPPTAWVEEAPASNMRLAQYRVGNDGECVVFYFGPGQGGDPMSNARRWGSFFTQPDGTTSEDLVEINWLEDTAVPVMLVAVSGTYDGGTTMTAEPAPPRPGYRLLGGIAEGPDAQWFFRLTGPEATVKAQREAFVDMMRSIRKGG